jgi:hypothetical protein
MYSLRYKLLYVSYNQVQGCERIGYTDSYVSLVRGTQIAIWAIIHVSFQGHGLLAIGCDFWII